MKPVFDMLETRELMSVGAPVTPQQLSSYYHLNHFPGKGAGATIAIVVAYDNAATDLRIVNQYDKMFHLPPIHVNVDNLGGTNNSPFNWSQEAITDMEVVHSIAPFATIDLVETVDDSYYQMINVGVTAAANLPNVSVVSESWGSAEFSTEADFDYFFHHPNVTYVASDGDVNKPNYPAVSPYSIDVGTSYPKNHPRPIEHSKYYINRNVPDVHLTDQGTFYRGSSVSTPIFDGIMAIADGERSMLGKPNLNTFQVRAVLVKDPTVLPNAAKLISDLVNA